MDKEFLEDYGAEENSQIQDYLTGITSGEITQQRFPRATRFRKMHDPVVYLENGNILWPTVAFSGSTIIPLYPVSKQMFEAVNFFKASQIPEIVSYAEETGKIQFVLMRNPTEFLGFDYMAPILEQLRPPQIEGLPPDLFADKKCLKNYFEEFQTLKDLGFMDFFEQKYKYSSNHALFYSSMERFATSYVMTKCLAEPKLGQIMEDALVSDFRRFIQLAILMQIFVYRPLFNPLKCSEYYDSTSITMAASWASKEGIKVNTNKPIPCEFGKLLMHKLTLYPESLESCKQLSARYQDIDLQRLLQAVNESILNKMPDAIEKNELILSSALDNIWLNRSFEAKMTGVKFGIPLALGVIGNVVGGLTGSYMGLLAGLGLNALDTMVQLKQDGISERAAKSLSSSQQVAIFDFKKKYSLQ